ncbi:hypothetical protein fHeYen901_3 [Yersinia phage fHe-Yen9-01]|uniref:Uncharacterized protein n=1 Tax=Yersinia phage fHe-Yen9-01 TaxID=1965363 RepID=A0A1V0DXA8_9CAUD|nr:hypothetical protein KNT60_gp002 [Yersinia phage fHe-Yen9-01]ARB05776.1 hypothetical protein fHeYen901_3 [Yersinia phage fHe-Yen9-01]
MEMYAYKNKETGEYVTFWDSENPFGDKIRLLGYCDPDIMLFTEEPSIDDVVENQLQWYYHDITVGSDVMSDAKHDFLEVVEIVFL